MTADELAKEKEWLAQARAEVASIRATLESLLDRLARAKSDELS